MATADGHVGPSIGANENIDSHELGTPLSAVSGFTELLEHSNLTYEQHAYVHSNGGFYSQKWSRITFWISRDKRIISGPQSISPVSLTDMVRRLPSKDSISAMYHADANLMEFESLNISTASTGGNIRSQVRRERELRLYSSYPLYWETNHPPTDHGTLDRNP